MNLEEFKTHIWNMKNYADLLAQSYNNWLRVIQIEEIDLEYTTVSEMRNYNQLMMPYSNEILSNLNFFSREIGAISNQIISELDNTFNISIKSYKFVRNEVEHNSSDLTEIELAMYVIKAIKGVPVNSTSPYGNTSVISCTKIEEMSELLNEFYFRFINDRDSFIKIYHLLDKE